MVWLAVTAVSMSFVIDVRSSAVGRVLKNREPFLIDLGLMGLIMQEIHELIPLFGKCHARSLLFALSGEF